MDAIESEQEARARRHQERVMAFEARASTAISSGKAALVVPLMLLANGDSWFNYPLVDNGPLCRDTDIIVKLGKIGRPKPFILSVAHWGDTSVDELALPKQKRMKEQLQNKANWGARGKPDAILISAGGNDIAGDQFCIFINDVQAGRPLNRARLQEALGMIEASYQELFDFRNKYAHGVPIYGHCYDFAVPDGSSPPFPGVGPWLKPSFDFSGQTSMAANKQAVADALKLLKTLLTKLASKASNRFHLIDTQGTITRPSEWANELHPTEATFEKFADVFRRRLAADFPGRI
ncbi:MAG: SGNH/GDSL hydrolase family protein [Mesorhizobium sp.]|uniref:SGNH/GDSL hydrolase family protein n=2 Tax=Mesorhizobium TaxID=68287 RepID=UPI000FCC1F64|nr:SGNH/GDSL hydrolase family protein [Mesorhizobium sp. M4A.F.Ca.ET.090.04.2.1]TIU69190.1 MAG: SGNH/GDSL hydrolase family protein [Mesorhizobium sp.]TIW42115.1 MAG: SGNH/GDSL hydrolase family protein [Mesorhizobium sp.]TIW64339.1 MAG: SGNH/GDSL hydrolase family protein [Mesorhizobium sp.]